LHFYFSSASNNKHTKIKLSSKPGCYYSGCYLESLPIVIRSYHCRGDFIKPPNIVQTVVSGNPKLRRTNKLVKWKYVPRGYNQNSPILAKGLLPFYLVHSFPRMADVRLLASFCYRHLISFPGISV
jgi:hypothetical protein